MVYVFKANPVENKNKKRISDEKTGKKKHIGRKQK